MLLNQGFVFLKWPKTKLINHLPSNFCPWPFVDANLGHMFYRRSLECLMTIIWHLLDDVAPAICGIYRVKRTKTSNTYFAELTNKDSNVFWVSIENQRKLSVGEVTYWAAIEGDGEWSKITRHEQLLRKSTGGSPKHFSQWLVENRQNISWSDRSVFHHRGGEPFNFNWVNKIRMLHQMIPDKLPYLRIFVCENHQSFSFSAPKMTSGLFQWSIDAIRTNGARLG